MVASRPSRKAEPPDAAAVCSALADWLRSTARSGSRLTLQGAAHGFLGRLATGPTENPDFLLFEGGGVLEESLDLEADPLREIEDRLEPFLAVRLQREHCQTVVPLVTASGARVPLLDLQQSERPAGDDDPGIARHVPRHPRVQRIAVLRTRGRDEPPVVGVDEAERQGPRHGQDRVLDVVLELDRRAPGRLDDDVHGPVGTKGRQHVYLRLCPCASLARHHLVTDLRNSPGGVANRRLPSRRARPRSHAWYFVMHPRTTAVSRESPKRLGLARMTPRSNAWSWSSPSHSSSRRSRFAL